MTTPPADGLHVTRLYLHPVKGMAAVPVEHLDLDDVGPVGDRRWMVVDPSGERFLTQRDHPRMALMEAALRPGGGVTLRAEGSGEIHVDEPPPDAAPLEVPVWGDRTEAVVASSEAAGWLTEALGEPAVLVRLPDRTVRPVAAERSVAGFHNRVAFADDEPLHLLTEASVEELDARVSGGAGTVTVERFRPNVVVGGAGPWEEDRWRRIRIGEVVVALVQPRARCVVTTVDPRTGEKGKEPLTTLRTFRRHDGNVWVGQNAVHASTGRLSVGDEVVVEASGEPRPPLPDPETIDR